MNAKNNGSNGNFFIKLSLCSLLFSTCFGDNLQIRQDSSTRNKLGKLISQKLDISYSPTDFNESFIRPMVCGKYSIDSGRCAKVQASLKNLANFNVTQIITNPLKINKFNNYSIEYTTLGASEKQTPLPLIKKVSGKLLFPKGISANKIKGIIIYYHGTMFNDNNISAENKYLDKILDSIYLTQGYIVLKPDYLGYGPDRNEMHPYVIFPKENALSGLNMLVASKSILKKLGINHKLNLYLTGYSEGGAYTLWASRLLQYNYKHILKQTNTSLKMTVPVAGAYDLTNAQIPFELANVTESRERNTYNVLSKSTASILKPSLTSFLMVSFSNYYKVPCDDLAYRQFCNLSNIKTEYNLEQLFKPMNHQSEDEIIKNLYNQATKMSFSYSLDSNSVSNFMITPLNPKFLNTLHAADIVKWKTNSPISLVYLKNDSVVTNINSLNAYNGLKELSLPTLVKKVVIDNQDFIEINGDAPIDHGDIISYIVALDEFNHHR